MTAHELFHHHPQVEQEQINSVECRSSSHQRASRSKRLSAETKDSVQIRHSVTISEALLKEVEYLVCKWTLQQLYTRMRHQWPMAAMENPLSRWLHPR